MSKLQGGLCESIQSPFLALIRDTKNGSACKNTNPRTCEHWVQSCSPEYGRVHLVKAPKLNGYEINLRQARYINYDHP